MRESDRKPKEANLSLRRSRRWAATAVTALALVSVGLLTACGNRVYGDSGTPQPTGVSLVAEPVATRGVPTPVVDRGDVCNSIEYLGRGRAFSAKEKDEILSRLVRTVKPKLLENTTCKGTHTEFSFDPTTTVDELSVRNKNGDWMITTIVYEKGKEPRTDSKIFPRNSANPDRPDPNFFVTSGKTPRESVTDLVSYASDKIEIPKDTRWKLENRYQSGSDRPLILVRGTSQSTGETYTIWDQGQIFAEST